MKSETKNKVIQKDRSPAGRERMDIVVVGHVDHGKSTLIGRLLADTGSLPKGKLDQVKATCEKNAKPFEYAFLLDALKDEQAQGITIDTARCFFKTKKRDYIIIDAPGHIEFLKNMITGAARAEAAILVIDAKEGVQENSRRHGYMMSMLGIKQLVVCVNKMDLVNYSEDIFNNIVAEYTEFLGRIKMKPETFIPISAREGDGLAQKSKHMAWYTGKTVLEVMDHFKKEASELNKPFRFPIQDIYKFTNFDDDRRIIAGRVESGSISVGDDVIFFPSGKTSKVASLESFNTPVKKQAQAGEAVGFTLSTQIYIRPGEMMCKTNDLPAQVTSQIRVSMFWLGRRPFVKGKQYKLKIATMRTSVWLGEINHILDASELSTVTNKSQVDRHDVAECILHTLKPIALDIAEHLAATSRFVIVDDYEIAGGGIVLEALGKESQLLQNHIQERDRNWDRSQITPGMREGKNGQRSTMIVFAGSSGVGKRRLAKALEEELFRAGRQVYYLGLSNTFSALDRGITEQGERDEYLRRLGEISHMFTDAGLILITTLPDPDDDDIEILKTLNAPADLILVNVGENRFQKIKTDADFPGGVSVESAVADIQALLQKRNVLMEYYL
ncbi:GTP-binding protein [PVC group bacterium]|nr:GTP-binding protein [PVC group bacterium]